MPYKLSAPSTGTPRERVVLNYFLERGGKKQNKREIARFATPETNRLQKKKKKEARR